MATKKADEEAGAKGYEVLGTVARVLRCMVTDSDKRASDDALHALIEAEKAVRVKKLRVASAAKKIAERLKALDEEQLVLHDARALTEVERTVRCEVRRSETETWGVRLDTGIEVWRRALTAEEHAQIHPVLPGQAKPTPHAAELAVDDETRRRCDAEAQHVAKVKDLLKDFDVQAALDGTDEPANDDADEDDEPEEKPAKKGRGKGKKKAETVEMFDRSGK